MKICILSSQHFSKKHVSEDTIDAFEQAIFRTKLADVLIVPINELIFKSNIKLRHFISLLDYNALQKIQQFNPDYVFIMAMSPEKIVYQKKILRKIKAKKIVYCVDTWESRMNDWRNILLSCGIEIVFCSNIRSVDRFKSFINNVFYLPYSMNEKWFYPRENMKKKHLFMQMGRKNSVLEQYVIRYLTENNLSDEEYIREKNRGEIIYEDFNTLAEEINRTLFFIVSPRDMEEKDITGSVSDVTARYYEGMACKTLLVGYKPKDSFDLLFHQKNAMIVVDSYEDFKDKIDYYREHFDQYTKIVDENYRELIDKHTWEKRVKTLIETLRSLKYENKQI